MIGQLQGRNAIITGANQGLGLAIARAYVEHGANVCICARDTALLERARAELVAIASPGQTIVALTADVSDAVQVDAVYRAAQAAFTQIHVLVNNAGTYGPFGPIEAVDWDDWVKSIQVNLFGSVLMCRALVPHFKTVRYGKIVQISGGGATKPLPRISGYAASKAAVIRFAETLAEEVREHGIDVNAIAPGSLNTRLLDQVLDSGPELVGTAFYERAIKQREDGGAPLERGASLAVFLGSSKSDGITGKLLSAMWDPWEDLAQHIDDLRSTDIYTLRRVELDDRSVSWKPNAKQD